MTWAVCPNVLQLPTKRHAFSPGAGQHQDLSPISGPIKAQLVPFLHRRGSKDAAEHDANHGWTGAPWCLSKACYNALSLAPLPSLTAAGFWCLPWNNTSSHNVSTACQLFIGDLQHRLVFHLYACHCKWCFETSWQSKYAIWVSPVVPYFPMY